MGFFKKVQKFLRSNETAFEESYANFLVAEMNKIHNGDYKFVVPSKSINLNSDITFDRIAKSKHYNTITFLIIIPILENCSDNKDVVNSIYSTLFNQNTQNNGPISNDELKEIIEESVFMYKNMPNEVPELPSIDILYSDHIDFDEMDTLGIFSAFFIIHAYYIMVGGHIGIALNEEVENFLNRYPNNIFKNFEDFENQRVVNKIIDYNLTNNILPRAEVNLLQDKLNLVITDSNFDFSILFEWLILVFTYNGESAIEAKTSLDELKSKLKRIDNNYENILCVSGLMISLKPLNYATKLKFIRKCRECIHSHLILP